MNKFGYCEKCGDILQPYWFEETEYADKTHCVTGRVRLNVSHLTCDNCLTNYCVDDSFACEWRYK